MSYYTIWSWVLLYAALLIWLPVAKLLQLLPWAWLQVTAPLWGQWLLVLAIAVALGLKRRLAGEATA